MPREIPRGGRRGGIQLPGDCCYGRSLTDEDPSPQVFTDLFGICAEYLTAARERGVTEDRLRNPDWVRRDLDEFLRLDSPVSCMARVATRDVELNGAHIKAAERVQVRYDSASRDPARFRDADTLVFDEPRRGHAAFGFGVHRCVGSNLARLQIEVAFDELLRQVRNLRLAPGAEITWMPGNSNVLHAVNLEFDRVG